jgi:hypothetical protein
MIFLKSKKISKQFSFFAKNTFGLCKHFEEEHILTAIGENRGK